MTPVVHQSSPACLARFKAQSEGADLDSMPARLGSAVHAALEAFVVAAETGDADPRGQALDALATWHRGDRSLHGDWLREAFDILTDVLEDEYMRSRLSRIGAGRMRRAEWTWVLDGDFKPVWERPGRFVPHERHAEPHPRAAYAGTIDVIEFPVREGAGPVRVIDYKTGLAWPTEDELRRDWQANVYAFAVLAAFPDQPLVEWETWQLREQRIVKAEFVAGERWQERTGRILKAKRARLLAAAKRDEWPADLGPDCDYCPVKFSCEAWTSMRDRGSADGLDAEQTVRAHLALKSYASELERRAKDAASDQRFDLGDGEFFGPWQDTAHRLTMPLREVLADLGKDLPQELIDEHLDGDRVSRGALRRLLYAASGRYDELNECALVPDVGSALDVYYEPHARRRIGRHRPEE